MRRHYYGATAAPAPKQVVVVKRPATVSGIAAGVVNLAAKPVRFGLVTAGSVVKWAGSTLQGLASKL